MTRPGALRRWTAALGAVVLSGCYGYVPVARPGPGTLVRAHVPVTRSVGSSVGEPQMVAFEGTVVSFGDTLLLQTKTQRPMGNFREMVITDTIRVASSALTGIEERVLSKPRTTAFTVALVGGAVLLGLAIDGLAGDEGEGKPPGPDPQGSVVPAFPRSGPRILGVRIPLSLPGR